MKPAAFTIERPDTLEAAEALLRGRVALPIAGGQSLGPMLNLRAARPDHLVPLDRLEALHGAEDAPDAITLGACTTHAAIADGRTPDFADGRTPDFADGRTPDFAGGILAGIAANIAYRAVRTRGTLGGSLCHADPAADWLTTLTALDAIVLTSSRAVALDQFVSGPYQTALHAGELLRAVRIPRPAAAARWGYHKLCRKPGEFAHAMAACLLGGPAPRVVLGAMAGPPLLLTGDAATIDQAAAALDALPAVERHLHLVALRRAMEAAT